MEKYLENNHVSLIRNRMFVNDSSPSVLGIRIFLLKKGGGVGTQLDIRLEGKMDNILLNRIDDFFLYR